MAGKPFENRDPGKHGLGVKAPARGILTSAVIGMEEIMCEKMLWVAVLEQAIEDATALPRTLAECPPSLHHCADTARDWFMSHDTGVGSFYWICRMLAITPSRLVQLMPVLEKTHQPNARVLH